VSGGAKPLKDEMKDLLTRHVDSEIGTVEGERTDFAGDLDDDAVDRLTSDFVSSLQHFRLELAFERAVIETLGKLPGVSVESVRPAADLGRVFQPMWRFVSAVRGLLLKRFMRWVHRTGPIGYVPRSVSGRSISTGS
jgi:hypothetical protein